MTFKLISMTLILGAHGMLGTAFKKMLDGHKLTHTALSSQECDITNRDAVFSAINRRDIFCINCAAYTKVDLAESEKEKAFQVNATGVKNIAEACAKHGVALIHFSTDYVFDGKKKSGYAEADTPHPLSVYGESKLAGEKAVEAMMGRTPYYIVRTSWLYGPNGKNFVATIARLLKEKPELKVVNDQFGSPTYTMHLALAVLQNFLFPQELLASGIYHLTNSGTTTWYEFAKEIAALTESATPVLPITTEEYPLPAKRPHYSTLINTKLSQLKDWKVALKNFLKNN